MPLADFVIDEIILQRRHYDELKEYLGDEFYDPASMMRPFVDEVIPESKNAHSLDMTDVAGYYDI